MSELTELVYVTDIKTTPALLWRALTEDEFTMQYWFDSRIESTWEPGAPVAFWKAMPLDEAKMRGMQINEAGEALTTTGEVVAFAPFETLAYTFNSRWDEEGRAANTGAVTFSLEPNGDSVKLTVVHARIPNRGNLVETFNGGWTGVIANLKALLESTRAHESRAERTEPVSSAA